MTSERQYSDEYLNSFIDNELTAREKSRLYQHSNEDEALNRRICELRKMHELVQLAYKHPPAAAKSGSAQPTPRLRHGVAASFALILGALIGWQYIGPTVDDLAGQTTHNPERQLALADQAQPDKLASSPVPATGKAPATTALTAPVEEMKVLFHLSNNDPARVRELLDEAENLLRLYQKQNQPARVEIITNGDGLNLLLAGRSMYPERIKRMQKQYKNLVFAACLNTMETFNGQGVETRLLPGTIVIDSGVAQIIRMQQQGWVYIQV